MADERRDFERDDLDYRRGLSVEEKVDLLLDRFLGNRLRGTIGQVDVLSAINSQLQSVSDRQSRAMEAVDRISDQMEAIAEDQRIAKDERNNLRLLIDRNHSHTAQRFADADTHFSKQLDGIWSWMIALIVGSSAHLVAIVVLIIIVYMMWQTVYDDAVAALYRAAWLWGIP